MTRINSLYGSQTSPVVCACKTTRLTSEILVSMGPSLHLWFLHSKLRLYDQNYKSLLVPHLIYGFLHSKQRLYPQNCNSLWVPALIYGFCMQNCDFRTRIVSLYGSQPSSVVFAFKTATFGSKLQVSMGPRPHLSYCACKIG